MTVNSDWEFFYVISCGGGKRYYREEELHSNILAWLFSGEESHGLEAKFLKTFLSKAGIEEEIDANCSVEREVVEGKGEGSRKADIVIETERAVVVIENKWDAPLGDRQVQDTYRMFSESSRARGKTVYYCVLPKNEDVKADLSEESTRIVQ